MDVERTIGFILQHEAKTAALLDEIAERQRQADLRADRAERRLDRLERLARLGGREFARHRRAMVELDQRLATVAELQAVTERKLQAFIDSLGKSTDGHN